MSGEKSNSPWVWIFLILLLTSFVVFIIFLDQKIVASNKSSSDQQSEEKSRPLPTIDFYSVLPDRKVEIPTTESGQEGLKNPSLNKDSSGRLILQVGSFQSSSEADSRKAELAFLGLETQVSSAVVNSATWHRVQVGPFASNSALSRAKNLLLENKIEYMQRSLPQ